MWTTNSEGRGLLYQLGVCHCLCATSASQHGRRLRRARAARAGGGRFSWDGLLPWICISHIIQICWRYKPLPSVWWRGVKGGSLPLRRQQHLRTHSKDAAHCYSQCGTTPAQALWLWPAHALAPGFVGLPYGGARWLHHLRALLSAPRPARITLPAPTPGAL